MKRLALLFLLAACAAPRVSADGGVPPHEPTTTTTHKPEHTTTTTAKPHHTTTTKPSHTTTTKPEHVTTTTKKPHATTTTVKQTTTTAGPTTTVKQTTTTTGGGTTTTTIRSTTTTTGGGGTTTTSSSTTSTALSTTTTTGGGGTTTTTIPRGQFGFNAASVCPPSGVPSISITFGNRPDLNGQSGELSMIALPSGLTVAFQPLVFQSGQTVTIPYPTVPAGTTSVTLNYNLAGEFQTAVIDPPLTNCATTTTTAAPTTTTTLPGVTTTTSPGVTTTSSSSTSTTAPATTTTTVAPPLALSGAATVCRAEVPTIVITFGNTFPELAGRTGTLTMSDVNGNVVSTQPLVYTPNSTVELLYPGTSINPDGSIADVPGWILQPNGLWVRDPSDEFLREGILLTYELNPTATALVSYPPESEACSNPENPPGSPTPPGAPPAPPGAPPVTNPPGQLPPTGNEPWTALTAAALLGAGALLKRVARRD